MRNGLSILLAMLVLSGCSQVQTKQLDDSHYVISRTYTDTPGDLSSHALASRAEAVCPEGYLVDSKDAAKAAEFGYSDEQCVYKHCDYRLEWRIHCVEKPKEAFSIFGKH